MARKEMSDYPAKKKRLSEALAAGVFSPGYLICGEEDYLRRQDTRWLLEKLGAREGDMNFTRFSGRETDAAEVIGTAMTMPFFADRRVILVEDSGWFAAKKRKDKEAAEAGEGADPAEAEAAEAGGGNEAGRQLAAYLKEAPSTAHIVFSESDVSRATTLFKTIDKAGFVLSCDPPSEAELSRWIAKRFADNGLKVEAQAAERLLSLTAGGASNEPRIDMNRLANEMEKLISYCMGRDAVRLSDVEAICSDAVMDSVFAMVDRMVRGDRQGAMALYQDMLAMKQPPFRILVLIRNQFNNILQVSELMQTHRSQQEIAAKLSMNPYVVKLCMGWSRNYPKERLIGILTACAEEEQAIKRGRMTDVIAVESVIAGAGRK